MAITTAISRKAAFGIQATSYSIPRAAYPKIPSPGLSEIPGYLLTLPRVFQVRAGEEREPKGCEPKEREPKKREPKKRGSKLLRYGAKRPVTAFAGTR